MSRVSAIVPTIGRPESLRALLESLSRQTVHVAEVVVADGSDADECMRVTADPCWKALGLEVTRLTVRPPNAVRQRQRAIERSTGGLLLLLDDDVVLEPDCLEQMLGALKQPSSVVAVCATFNNQSWAMPTRVWRYYLRWFCNCRDGEWQGKVIGPLLRYGFKDERDAPAEMEWLGAGMSLVVRTAYEEVGGFSDFFLHRCTMNEDVDLGIKLRRAGKILFCPSARLSHFHAPGGRLKPMVVAEDDLYNRFWVLHHTQGRRWLAAFALVLLYFAIETLSSLLGGVSRLKPNGFIARFWGRLRAVVRIVLDRKKV